MRQDYKTRFTIVSVLTATLTGTACNTEKSSNPLSPQIAGPLAGVTITSPTALKPPEGKLIANTEQPLTLIFANAASNSVRPFTYELQISIDREFTQVVLEVTGVEPDDTDQVVLNLPRTLESEQVYYWRVRAVDGANSGIYSGTVSFEIFTPVVVGIPNANSPVNGQTIPTNLPTLVAEHANITGPAEAVTYRFELAADEQFVNPSAVLTVNQANGTSTSVSPAALPYDHVFYWRVRASAEARNGRIIGPWSATANFRTPSPPVIIGTPTPVSPIDGATSSSRRPILTATEGVSIGSVGAITYRFEVGTHSSFANPVSIVQVSQTTAVFISATISTELEPAREYYWRVNGSNEAAVSPWSSTQLFRTPSVATPPIPPGQNPGPRTPDPPPGNKLPLPNEATLITAVANANPDALANSCIEEGGTWEFMDLAVAALRAKDNRWGYNCKRGDCSQPSTDVVDYFWGIGGGQNSTDVYLIDIISSVCPGGNQSPTWIDQTDATVEEGTVGRWIYPRP